MQASIKILYLWLFAAILIDGKTRKHSRPRRWFELLSDCTEEDECFGDHCLHFPPPNNTTPGPEPSPELFSILGQGLEQIDNYTSTEYGILLLGNTGSGKSTLAQIVAGNLTQVHSVCSSSCTFVIIDENDKIGAPSTKSKTLVPEVIYKPSAGPNETDLPFYDCPGFDDTRGFEMDIAANFFMNRVTKKPAHLKLLFVTPQKVFSTGDRTSFDKLVTHATKFVVDMEKYIESLGLVVTMAPNYNNAGRPVSANTIINGVVEFIKIYMNDQDCANTQDYRQIKKCKLSQKLIEINSTTGKYDRIGFVRIPKDCGPLSDLDDMKYARGNITLLYERLQFTKVDSAKDFAFTLSDSTLPNVQNYTRSINYNVMRAIDSVTTGFTRAYNTTIQQQTNWFTINLQRRQEILQRFHDTLSRTIQAISDLPKITLVLKASRDAFALMDYDVPMAYQDFLEQQETYMEFFTEVTGEQQTNPDIWLSPLKTLTNTLAEHRDWYEFCFTVELTVMSYSIHINKPSLPTDPNFIDWIDYINSTISRVPSNILSISKKISSSEFNLLGVMLQYVLQPCTVKCQNDSKELYMQQNYFKLSDLSNQITEWISLCAVKPSKVFINVGHTVFLDATRTILNDMDLTLIAPYWVTVGGNKSNEIRLEGSNGISFDTPAKHGEEYTGQFGDHGCAGRMGNQDGSLVAFAKSVSSDAQINVNLQTGDGGNGQVGGQGGIGYSRHATPDDPEDDNCTVSEKGAFYLDHWGFDGDSGGAGGNGGAAGDPGPRFGNITFHCLSSFDGLHRTKRMGIRGSDATGGKGGLGGAPGDGL